MGLSVCDPVWTGVLESFPANFRADDQNGHNSMRVRQLAVILPFATGTVAHPNIASAAPTVTPNVSWGCHGHANPPHAAKDQYGNSGIGFDGYMDCVGGFIRQRVCVKLQEKDYFGEFYDRTSLSCNGETVAAHAFVGRWVSCVQALSGTYRTYLQGTAYPTGPPGATSVATSLSAAMCGGFFAPAKKKQLTL
jgi:hypothetical protein